MSRPSPGGPGGGAAASCPGVKGCSGAQCGPPPTGDACFCDQPGAFIRKDTMTTTYQAEVSALAELLKDAYASMKPCGPCVKEPAPLPPRICYRPALPPWEDTTTCGNQPVGPPRIYRQLPLPTCAASMTSTAPRFTATAMMSPPQGAARGRVPNMPNTNRTILGHACPAPKTYVTGYSEYQDSIGLLGRRIRMKDLGCGSPCDDPCVGPPCYPPPCPGQGRGFF